MSPKFHLVVEEILCRLVCLYPVIYDKLHKGYHERDTIANAFEEIYRASLELVSDDKILLLLGDIHCCC